MPFRSKSIFGRVRVSTFSCSRYKVFVVQNDTAFPAHPRVGSRTKSPGRRVLRLENCTTRETRLLPRTQFRGPVLAWGNYAVLQGGLRGAITPSGKKADCAAFSAKKTITPFFLAITPFRKSANHRVSSSKISRISGFYAKIGAISSPSFWRKMRLTRFFLEKRQTTRYAARLRVA